MPRKASPKRSELPLIRLNAAGIDIGATQIFVAVPAGRDLENKDVRSFDTFTQDLYMLAAWLTQCGVDTVAMESTGVYWIPLFQILEERGFEVFLVNARHVQNVPGRKTDVKDCQWIQFLHSVGLLQASYRPPQEICAIRSLLRHRDSLVKTSSRHIQHMQKSMDQMNLKLHHVISEIAGKSGLAIVQAILDGEREPEKLAALCSSRIKASKEVVAKSLVGDYRREHIFTLRQSLEAYRHCQHLINELDNELQNVLEELNPCKRDNDGSQPFSLTRELKEIFGVDLTRIPSIAQNTAQAILAEVGPNFTKFRSASAFASWLTLCPDNKISGGKVISKQTRKSKSRATTALRMAALSLHRSDSWLGNFYRRLRTKLGGPKAVTATAHKIARIIYHLVTTRQEYDESRFETCEIRNRKRRIRNVTIAAKRLGYDLIPA
jgi:transposase